MVKYFKRKRFDEDADWVPQKGREFKMKTSTPAAPSQAGMQPVEEPPKKERDLSFALKGPAISDAEGLERAYDAPGSTYTYGDTIFIAGTKGTPLVSSDWMQNYKYLGIPWLTGNPVETDKTDRYKDAERAQEATPYANKRVAHSLGGSVAIEQQKQRGGLTGNLYGTPYVDPWGQEAFKDFLDRSRKERNEMYGNGNFLDRGFNWLQDKEQDGFEWYTGMDKVKGMTDSGFTRYRSALDLVSALDNSAKTSIHTHPWDYLSFTHDYHPQASQNFTASTDNALGWKNDDGSISLRE